MTDRNEALRLADSIHEMNNAAYMTAIANLREQVTRANRETTRIVALLDAANDGRDKLRAEVERLRADAERYRILRQQHEEADSGLTLCVFHPVNDSTLEPVGSMPGELDTAIDRARTTHKDEG